MRRLIVMSLIGLLLTLSTTAFGQDEGFPTVVDAYGEEIVIEDASRLVTMGGSVTEIVFALGAGERVVARDSSSLYPLVVEELDEVGYVRQLSAEPILAMEPTLIITIEDAGPPEAIEQLQAAGVTMLVVPTAESVEGVVEKVNTIAMALELEDEGVTLVETIEANYASALALQEDIESTPRVMFLYARGAGAVSVSGTDTSANTMIELVGAENAVTEFDGYQPITAESVVTAAPDVILLMTRGLASLGGVDGLLEQPHRQGWQVRASSAK
ncbi:MAG: ABC transporter substrate-binding protein [Chloroflexota bacterium]